MTDKAPQIDPAGCRELLALARRTLESYLQDGQPFPYLASNPALKIHSGAFVSLHAGSHLRGCIGQIIAEQELYRTVQQCAISAAVDDYRFAPVTREELRELVIEISVLTPMQRLQNFEEVEVGRHGLYIVRGIKRGLLLPQVATEYGWDRESFLVQTCRKAGLRDDAWGQPGTAVYTFEAQVFGE